MAHEGNFHVGSEVGKLRRVMLHRPGKELERLTIVNKDELLFDDILWLEEAQKEHDAFADLLRSNNIEVVYFEDCLEQVLKESEIRSELLSRVLSLEALDFPLLESLKATLMEAPSDELIEHLIAGITKEEAREMMGPCKSLVCFAIDDYDFLIRPLPNLYFQRDPYFFVKDGVVISVMSFPARAREPLYAKYIFKYHPYFKDIKIYFGEDPMDAAPYHIEGGDVHVLSEDVLAIGVSQRTNAGTVQMVGRRLAEKAGIRKVLAVDIPKNRAYMHLDTVFTMVDRDAFTIYPGVHKVMKIWELSYDEGGNLVSVDENDDLIACLKKNLKLNDIHLIETGGGNPVFAARDQWNDGTNTLAIAPGVVVTYRQNVVSNSTLRDHGISVFEIKGAELGRGRGGPRCMTMPLTRETFK